MVTGFDIWGHDAGLRRHWKGRMAAFLIDAVIAFVPVSAALYLMGEKDILLVGLANSVAFYLVSSVPESLTGASIGKKAFGFRVHPTSGESLAGRACLRNIPRLLWFALPPIDFAAGMALRGDPRHKLFDRIAGTTVVHRREKRKHDRAKKAAEGKGAKKAPAVEACQSCGGPLIRLPDEKLRCEKCGRIQ